MTLKAKVASSSGKLKPDGTLRAPQTSTRRELNIPTLWSLAFPGPPASEGTARPYRKAVWLLGGMT